MAHLERLEALVDLAGLDVVDVGAGTGAFAAHLASRGCKVVGIEVDEEKVSQARKDHGAEARFEKGRGEAIPLEEDCCDLATFIFSMHHVPKNLHAQTFEEARHILRPGGRLHVVEPDIVGPMTEVVTHIDDETEIRTAAQSFLNRLGDDPRVKRSVKDRYSLERTYRSFDDLLRSVVRVDAARMARLADAREAMHETFIKVARRDDNGYVLTQPCILHHFELV